MSHVKLFHAYILKHQKKSNIICIILLFCWHMFQTGLIIMVAKYYSFYQSSFVELIGWYFALICWPGCCNMYNMWVRYRITAFMQHNKKRAFFIFQRCQILSKPYQTSSIHNHPIETNPNHYKPSQPIQIYPNHTGLFSCFT
jgi:hypothetical protein